MSIVHSGFFFFQAEDGIRDLVRSRGLGDVYKRQHFTRDEGEGAALSENRPRADQAAEYEKAMELPGPVSYTHLTLPTSDLV